MHIYFSGIGGVGIGPLAEIALDAGYKVSGSDLQESSLTKALAERGANIHIGQDGSQIKEVHDSAPIDWFVYTSALPADHAELGFAKSKNLKSTKRDELLAHIIDEEDLKLIAVAGTHGKTTTTGMLVWLFQRCGIPISYSIGTTISFGPSGFYDPNSRFFVYECDEYDRNFLHFKPWISLITSLDHDHPDIYPTPDDYKQAFLEFLGTSSHVYIWQKDARYLSGKTPLDEAVSGDIPHRFVIHDDLQADLTAVPVVGEHNRRNGFLAVDLVADGYDLEPEGKTRRWNEIAQLLQDFPGTDRRFEKLADNLYSDYGHHPVEIAATLQLAREVSDKVVLVYQPHQNTRQHEVRHEYKDSMKLADTIYWLPTYLSREDPQLETLSPEQLIKELGNKDAAQPAELDDALWQNIQTARREGKLVLVMGAGSIDSWVRKQLSL